MLDIDDDGNSMPNANVRLVNGENCGNCGRDLTSSHQRVIIAKKSPSREGDFFI